MRSKPKPPTATARSTLYQAINRVTGYDVELVKYDLNAKGHGKDALGQVDIVVTTTAAASTAWVWRRISLNPPRKPWFTC
jgi:hypothetical protein